jgi:hypothetical protein
MMHLVADLTGSTITNDGLQLLFHLFELCLAAGAVGALWRRRMTLFLELGAAAVLAYIFLSTSIGQPILQDLAKAFASALTG